MVTVKRNLSGEEKACLQFRTDVVKSQRKLKNLLEEKLEILKELPFEEFAIIRKFIEYYNSYTLTGRNTLIEKIEMILKYHFHIKRTFDIKNSTDLVDILHMIEFDAVFDYDYYLKTKRMLQAGVSL